MNDEKKKPAHEIKLGRIKAVIWANETENGTRYNATIARLYRLKEDERKSGDNGWRESSSYGRDDLPLVLKVADLAHTWMYTQKKS